MNRSFCSQRIRRIDNSLTLRNLWERVGKEASVGRKELAKEVREDLNKVKLILDPLHREQEDLIVDDE